MHRTDGELAGLADLFPEGDYRFHLTLRRTEPATYFAPQDASRVVRAERERWLAADPGRYAILESAGEPLVNEFCALASAWDDELNLGVASAYDRLLALGRGLDADIVFLARDAEGRFRLRGGALCFPTGWALEEKMGQPLEAIHGVVPGLNAALGSQIQQFLSKLKPGVAFLRDNWGLAATEELNLNPARGIPPPRPPAALDRLWLRVEHQALLALPNTRGIAFGIRLALHRLDDVVRAGFGPALRRALATMPSQLVQYKRIDPVLHEVVALL